MTPYAEVDSKCEVERGMEIKRVRKSSSLWIQWCPVSPLLVFLVGGPSNHKVQWINIGPGICGNPAGGAFRLSFARDAGSVATLGDHVQASSGRPQK